MFDLKYRLLNLIEFTSSRKRMTVIVKTPEDRIRVMCKGADSIILPRLNKKTPHVEKTKEFLDEFSKEGLRTLVIAEKEVSEEYYQQWNQKFQQALLSTNNREEKCDKIAEEIE